MNVALFMNDLAEEAERDGLPTLAEGCRGVAAEIERLQRENRQLQRQTIEDFERLKSKAHD